jgi:nucleoside-diphosphate-sugar epimerase
VGSALGSALVEQGHDVVGTTTTPERRAGLERRGIQPMVVELSDEDRLAAMLHDREVVFLTVAPGGSDRSYRDVYLEGVRHLLASVGGSAVTRIVYTSSTSVYGQRDGGWVDEDSPTEPTSERGGILVETERAVLDGARARGMIATVLRVAGIYGPGRGPINRVVQYAGRQRTGGAVYVNLVHVEDIVQVCVKLLDVDYAGVLNLSDGHPVPRRTYYDRIMAVAGAAPIDWVNDDNSEDRGKRVSNRRIREVLDLRLRYPSYESVLGDA